MILIPTDEQHALLSALCDALDKEWTPTEVRAAQDEDATRPQRLWQVLAELGVFGLGLPEELGGVGGGLFELGLFFQAGGRVLCSTLVYSTLFTRIALQRLADADQQLRWLPRLATGELAATTLLWNASDSTDLSTPLVAGRTGDGWELSGTLDFVPNGDLADLALVSARVGDGDGERTICCVIELPRPGWTTQRHRTFTRENQCRVVLDRLSIPPADVIEDVDADALSWVSNAVSALQCMEMTGGTSSVIDRTVEYVQNREQFGRPIAGFQAAQHHVANMRIAADGARLTAYQAVWLLGRGPSAAREVAIAKLKAGEAYKFATLTAHQLHGGMGFLRETDLHLWSQRAKSTELLGGAWDVQLAALERALLGPAAPR
jgi:alkylation response protein AidB-like acyl-CoA dehydrogenase